MTKTKKTLLTAALLLTTGCASLQDPAAVARIADENPLALCPSVNVAGREAARAAVLERGLISPQEITLASQRRVFKGMSECGLLAAKGPALSVKQEADGQTKYSYGLGVYFFVDQGRVIGWEQKQM